MCAHVHATIVYTCALRLSKYVYTQPSRGLGAHSHLHTEHEAASRLTEAARRPRGRRGGQAAKGAAEELLYTIYTGCQYSSGPGAGRQHQAGRAAFVQRGAAAGGAASPRVAAAASRGGGVIRGGEGGGRWGEQGVDGTAAAGLLESISGPASPAGSKQRGAAGLAAATAGGCLPHAPLAHSRKVLPDGASSSRRGGQLRSGIPSRG